MIQSIKSTLKERQRMLCQQAEAAKVPYLVRDMPRTVLYLTPEQAARRLDLIPQIRQ